MKPQFRIDKRDGFWTADVYYISNSDQQELFSEWDGFEEPFSESTYQDISKWCYNTFKTYIWPRRARRMSYTQFWFKNKKDLDWFVLYWSGIDISEE
jgi:hypothetical protein